MEGREQTQMLHIVLLPRADGAIALEGFVLVFETKKVVGATATAAACRRKNSFTVTIVHINKHASAASQNNFSRTEACLSQCR